MALGQISWLWGLWLLPALAVLLHLARSAARRRTAAFVGDLAPRLVERPGGRTLRSVLVTAAIGAAVVALARPAWGVWYEEVRHEGVEVVVLLDVSRSMLAEDATPNRLRRAKIAVNRLVDRLEETGGHRVGLVAFAGTPSVRCPLTLDYRYFREVLARTDTDSATRGGTLVGDALRRGGDLFGDAEGDHRAMILLTDGEDHESFPLEAAAALAAKGVRIYTVGIGDSTDGRPIPVNRSESGSAAYVVHEGRRVVSRLDEEMLKAVASATGGAYVPAGTRAIKLGQIYEDAVASRAGSVHATTMERRLRERFQWFVGAALILALASRFAGRRPSATGDLS